MDGLERQYFYMGAGIVQARPAAGARGVGGRPAAPRGLERGDAGIITRAQ